MMLCCDIDLTAVGDQAIYERALSLAEIAAHAEMRLPTD